MPENLSDWIGPTVAVGVWLLWTFFSETRYNHGILIAFLLPLAMIVYLVVMALFILLRMVMYPIFAALGRKREYAALVDRVRSVLLL